jgi:multiple sugar transport system permease protein
MLISYFESIPRELDEAALVDGASPVVRRAAGGAAGHRRGGHLLVHHGVGETLFASVISTDATIPVVVGFLFLQK